MRAQGFYLSSVCEISKSDLGARGRDIERQSLEILCCISNQTQPRVKSEIHTVLLVKLVRHHKEFVKPPGALINVGPSGGGSAYLTGGLVLQKLNPDQFRNLYINEKGSQM